MTRTYLHAKIHRATVTDANPDYEGSVTIDQSLLEAADIRPYEAVHIWDVTNGERIVTYAIPGRPNTGVIAINGGAAHKIVRGDLVVIASFVELSAEESRQHKPRKIFVDDANRIRQTVIEA
ncbi:MAG: aspartate 1-decarboxylase [Deltaproteobacteria bacterium CG11_big_fil_rev_8_21_14_0_20_47_16]|nr:MAG: aspartate 1-decarboxylase [Deltaproteobacteria bacterium CG11_big_fil_rev_8_21_14_0_20_47_16]